MNNQNLNYIKYQKYKNKYLNLKNQIGGDECKYNKNKSRTPSNCDRIIYKSNDIHFLENEYHVITKNEFNLIQFSDHQMIYGIFNYYLDNYMIISWNIGAFDHKFDKKYESYIKNHINKFINEIIKIKIKKNNIKYLIFSFQESTKNSLFIQILKNMINEQLNMTLSKHILSNPNPLFSKFYVQLLVFRNKKTKTKIDDSGYYNLQVNNNEQNIIKILIQSIKNLFGTKSYVYIKMNNLMIVSTHFPIDTKHKDLGNSLRKLALEEIDKKFKKDTNLIIIGDLNFRKLNNIDQLDDLLKEKTDFKEAGKLLDTTCKYDECKLKCDNTTCTTTNK